MTDPGAGAFLRRPGGGEIYLGGGGAIIFILLADRRLIILYVGAGWLRFVALVGNGP